jgi:hypothetical protein
MLPRTPQNRTLKSPLEVTLIIHSTQNLGSLPDGTRQIKSKLAAPAAWPQTTLDGRERIRHF